MRRPLIVAVVLLAGLGCGRPVPTEILSVETSQAYSCERDGFIRSCVDFDVEVRFKAPNDGPTVDVRTIQVFTHPPDIAMTFRDVSCDRAPWVLDAGEWSDRISIQFAWDASAETYGVTYPCGREVHTVLAPNARLDDMPSRGTELDFKIVGGVAESLGIDEFHAGGPLTL